MDNHQQAALLNLFGQYRLSPMEPEHKLFIDAEIAKLEILDPVNAESFKKFYDGKMAELQAKADAEALMNPVETVEPVAPVVEVPVVEPVIETPVEPVIEEQVA